MIDGEVKVGDWIKFPQAGVVVIDEVVHIVRRMAGGYDVITQNHGTVPLGRWYPEGVIIEARRSGANGKVLIR